MNRDTGDMAWTIVRPCHIYGPGSRLGCLPEHGRDERLLERLRARETLRLVGGGHFLQQPIVARDLADLVLASAGRADLNGRIFQAAGPDVVESVIYYRILADILGVSLHIEEVLVDEYLADNPGAAPFLCHRIYDLAALREAGLPSPATPLAVGARSATTVSTSTPLSVAQRRHQCKPVSEMSVAVTVQPCVARCTALRPAPAARHRARPGIRACVASTRKAVGSRSGS
jgi:hypothetical protein